jgi:glycosyltransferase involved in cell wall biosynthesis
VVRALVLVPTRELAAQVGESARLLGQHLPVPLKIAVVTETYPPDINGVAHTLSKIVEGLQALGHDLWLIRPKQQAQHMAVQTAHFQEVLVKGVPIPFYNELRMGLPAKRELQRLWAKQRPDIVHIATEGPLGWSALQVARKLKLPVSTDFRTNFHAYSQHYGIGWLSGAIRVYLKKFHNRADVTMVPTAMLQHELQAKGFERVQVVPRGVDTSQFSPSYRSLALRQSWGVAEDDRVLLYVGRLAAEKNLGLVVQSYLKAKQHNERVRLVLVGDGPMRESLQQQHPDIVFAGYRSGADLAAHYASADVFVFASLTETFGNVTLEAMASGLAVVAFKHAAAGQCISHGDNGMCVDTESPQDFVQAVCAVVEAHSLQTRLAKQALLTAQTFDWPGVVQRTEAVFRQVMAGNYQQESLVLEMSLQRAP